MTQEKPDRHELVKLSDSDFRLEEPEEDLRGKDVYDRDGDQIGSVEDLYVDTEEREVRFLDVGAGGFLGLGEKHLLIPLEAVTDHDGDRVNVNRHRDQVLGSPPFDAGVVPTTDYQRGLYDYYGYPYPGWAYW